MDDELLWCGQTQNGVNLDFQVQYDLEGQCRSLHKAIGILNKVFYTFVMFYMLTYFCYLDTYTNSQDT